MPSDDTVVMSHLGAKTRSSLCLLIDMTVINNGASNYNFLSLKCRHDYHFCSAFLFKKNNFGQNVQTW